MTIFNEIVLAHGGHSRREQGICFMEAVAMLAGEAHGAHPRCVCPVLGSFLRNLNDRWGDERRQGLKPYLRLVMGTAGDGYQERRAFMLADFACRKAAPLALESAGRGSWASRLRALAPVVDRLSAAAAADAYAAASTAAYTAYNAADVASTAAYTAVTAAAYATAAYATADYATAAAVAAVTAAAAAAAADADAYAVLDRMLLLGLDKRNMPEIEIPAEPVLLAVEA